MIFLLAIVNALVTPTTDNSYVPSETDDTRRLIVGGEEAPILPYQVAFRKSGRHFCGGTFLSPTHVLSAAHCFDLGVTDVVAAYGMLGRTDNGTDEIPIKRIIPLGIPQWNGNPLAGRDIVLLELERPAETEHALLADTSIEDLMAKNTVATVSGWGTLRYQGQLATNLMQVDLPLVPCDTQGNHAAKEASDQFCAGEYEDDKDACQGDSGGPIVVKGPNGVTVIGIVSWGIGCSGDGKYTDVFKYRDELAKHLPAPPTTTTTTTTTTPPPTTLAPQIPVATGKPEINSPTSSEKKKSSMPLVLYAKIAAVLFLIGVILYCVVRKLHKSKKPPSTTTRLPQNRERHGSKRKRMMNRDDRMNRTRRPNGDARKHKPIRRRRDPM